jgi:hypothetical protein
MRGKTRCFNLPEAVRYVEDDCSYDLKKSLEQHLHWCEICAGKIRKLRDRKETDFVRWEKWLEEAILEWWHRHEFNTEKKVSGIE